MENTSVKPGKFVVPENYNEENIEDNTEPWIEDLEDDDVEIWFMQAPPSVDLSKIQGMPMKLDGKTYFDYEGLLGDKLESSAIPSTTGKSKGPQFSLIAPSKEDKKFRVVNKPFAGHILLTESFEVPLCSVPEETDHKRSDYPEKLKQKYPFGSYFVPNTESPQSPKKKKNKTKRTKDKSSNSLVFSSSDAEIENVLNYGENIKSPKKNTKHKASQQIEEIVESSSIHVENSHKIANVGDLSDLGESLVSDKKPKAKKKKKDAEKENVLIDDENIESPKKISKHKTSQQIEEIDESSSMHVENSQEVTNIGEVSNLDASLVSEKQSKAKKKKKDKPKTEMVSQPGIFDVSSETDYIQNTHEADEVFDKDLSKKKKKKKKKHAEDIKVKKSASSTENSDIESFKKPKLKKIEIKKEPMSPVKNDYSSIENHEISKGKKKKKKKDYSTDDSTETLPNNETGFMGSINVSQNTSLEVLNASQEDSYSHKKLKKKKKKIKEEPVSSVDDESYDSVETVNAVIKQEGNDSSYDSSSKSKSVKSSSKDKKSRDHVSKLDTTPVTSVSVQGKDFSLSEEFLKKLKSQKKKKKKSLDSVKSEPLSP